MPAAPRDAHAQGMAALVGAQVVQTVGQRQRLRISQALVHLFDAPVDISQYGVHLLDRLAVQRRAHAQYAMRGRMLRADVYDEVVRAEHHVLAPFDGPVRVRRSYSSVTSAFSSFSMSSGLPSMS